MHNQPIGSDEMSAYLRGRVVAGTNLAQACASKEDSGKNGTYPTFLTLPHPIAGYSQHVFMYATVPYEALVVRMIMSPSRASFSFLKGQNILNIKEITAS